MCYGYTDREMPFGSKVFIPKLKRKFNNHIWRKEMQGWNVK